LTTETMDPTRVRFVDTWKATGLLVALLVAGALVIFLVWRSSQLSQAQVDWCNKNWSQAAEYGGGVPLGADWGGERVTQERRDSCRRAWDAFHP
jgi:hypothetical protein